MNDSLEEEDFGWEEHRTLIGQGDDWPENYDYGFDPPMQVINKILLDSEAWDLPISWPEVLSGWTGADNLLKCLESIDDSSSAYSLFDVVDGCSVDHESWGGDSPGRSGCWVSVFVEPKKLNQALATVEKLADALEMYWVSGGHAAAAEKCEHEAKKRSS